MERYEVSLVSREGLEVVQLTHKPVTATQAVSKKQSALSMLNEALTGRPAADKPPEEFDVQVLHKCAKATGHIWASDGEHLATWNGEQVIIWNPEENWNAELTHTAPGVIKYVTWSATNRYISIISSASPPGKKCVEVIDLRRPGDIIISHQNSKTLYVQFGPEDLFLARIDSNLITIYDLRGTELQEFCLDDLVGINNAMLAPSRSPNDRYHIAVVSAGSSTSKATATSVKILSINLATKEFRVVASKNIFNIEETCLEWNSTSQYLLVKMHAEVDKAGKSYYGRSSLYMMSAMDTQITTVIPHDEGPVHSFSWSPRNAEEFAVVSGPIPTALRLFDARPGKPVIHLGKNPRNTLFYTKTGSLLCSAGFGNLPGDMDVWDMGTGRLVGSTKAPWVVDCEFSPDSGWILCATTTPRLRVDNGIRILRSTGEIALTIPVNELYKAYWRPRKMEERKLETTKMTPRLQPPSTAPVPKKRAAPPGLIVAQPAVGAKNKNKKG